MAELGGLAATLEAMRTFDADAEVQRGGAEVLAWMANTGSERGQKIASEGGIEVFVKAVRGFPDHEKVLVENLRALGNVAGGNNTDIFRIKIAEAGGARSAGVAAGGEARLDREDFGGLSALHIHIWVRSDRSPPPPRRYGPARAPVVWHDCSTAGERYMCYHVRGDRCGVGRPRGAVCMCGAAAAQPHCCAAAGPPPVAGGC